MNLNIATSIPLHTLLPGERATLFDLSQCRSSLSRLATLGFTPGVELTMNQNYGRGPLIVTVRGMQVALGRGEAAKILVQRREA